MKLLHRPICELYAKQQQNLFKERDLQRNFQPSTTSLFESPGQFVNKKCTPSHLFQVLMGPKFISFRSLADLFQMSGKFSEMQGGD